MSIGIASHELAGPGRGHGKLAQQVEHNAVCHQHHTGTDFNQTDILAKAVAGHMELMNSRRIDSKKY